MMLYSTISTTVWLQQGFALLRVHWCAGNRQRYVVFPDSCSTAMFAPVLTARFAGADTVCVSICMQLRSDGMHVSQYVPGGCHAESFVDHPV